MEESAEALLEGGDDLNEVDEYGQNALHMAAWKGCGLPLFNRILGMIRNVIAVTIRYIYTGLMQAVGSKNLDMVTVLMNHRGINVIVQDYENETALHWAVCNNDLTILAQLLSDDRVDTNLKNFRNLTPLMIAIDEDTMSMRRS